MTNNDNSRRAGREKLTLTAPTTTTTTTTSGCTAIHPPAKLIHHHVLKHVFLVVPVVENITIENVEQRRLHHEAAHAHPQAVGKRHEGERDDKTGEKRGHKDHKPFSREQVEKDPEHPGEEGRARRLQVVEPVRDGAED